MNYLLDTHALIWFLEGNEYQLPKHVVNQLIIPENNVFASIVSFWEMAIKLQINKLSLPNSLEEMMEKLDEAGLKLLPLNFEHITNLKSLPLHHRDPFDRLIISQAQVKNLTLVSKDRAFKSYSVKLLWESE